MNPLVWPIVGLVVVIGLFCLLAVVGRKSRRAALLTQAWLAQQPGSGVSPKKATDFPITPRESMFIGKRIEMQWASGRGAGPSSPSTSYPGAAEPRTPPPAVATPARTTPARSSTASRVAPPQTLEQVVRPASPTRPSLPSARKEERPAPAPERFPLTAGPRPPSHPVSLKPETVSRPDAIAETVPRAVARELIVPTIPSMPTSEPATATPTPTVARFLGSSPSMSAGVDSVATPDMARASTPVVIPALTLFSSEPPASVVEPPALPTPVVLTARPEALVAPIQRLALEQWEDVEVVSPKTKRTLTPRRLGADASASFEGLPDRPSAEKKPLDFGWGDVEVRRDGKSP